jgi:hypothetical protein
MKCFPAIVVLANFEIFRDPVARHGSTTFGPVHPACNTTFLEDVINILKLEALGFRKEEINEGYPESISNCKYDEDLYNNSKYCLNVKCILR